MLFKSVGLLTEMENIQLVLDISKALDTLHGLGFYHTDIQLKNILKDSKSFYLADFHQIDEVSMPKITNEINERIQFSNLLKLILCINPISSSLTNQEFNHILNPFFSRRYSRFLSMYLHDYYTENLVNICTRFEEGEFANFSVFAQHFILELLKSRNANILESQMVIENVK